MQFPEPSHCLENRITFISNILDYQATYNVLMERNYTMIKIYKNTALFVPIEQAFPEYMKIAKPH